MIGHDYSPGMVRVGVEPPEREEPTPYLFVSTVALPALRQAGVAEEDDRADDARGSAAVPERGRIARRRALTRVCEEVERAEE